MGVPTAYQNSDSDSSTTKSAVEKGELIIRNKEQQKQDINELSRDTESANNPLKQIFDKQKALDKTEKLNCLVNILKLYFVSNNDISNITYLFDRSMFKYERS